MQHVYRHVVRAVTGFSFTMQHHCDTCHEREPCEASDCHVGCQLATDCDSLCKHCSSTANTKTTETILLGCPSLRLLLLRRLLGPLRNLRAMLPSCFGQSLHRDGGVRLGSPLRFLVEKDERRSAFAGKRAGRDPPSEIRHVVKPGPCKMSTKTKVTVGLYFSLKVFIHLYIYYIHV